MSFFVTDSARQTSRRDALKCIDPASRLPVFSMVIYSLLHPFDREREVGKFGVGRERERDRQRQTENNHTSAPLSKFVWHILTHISALLYL